MKYRYLLRIPVSSFAVQTFLLQMFVLCLLIFSSTEIKAQENSTRKPLPPKYVPDLRIDNMGYWRQLVEYGLVTVQPAKKAPLPLLKSTLISTPGIATYDSPDIPVTDNNSLQSENSVFTDPSDASFIVNSNNSHPAPYVGTQFGADALQSADGGQSWEGTVQGVGGYNFGDPATAINLQGRMFIGTIFSGGGQGIAYSDDRGITWKKKAVAPSPGGLGSILDKNHLWVDNSPDSPYEGNLYDGWTVFGSDDGSGHLQVSRSLDNGMAWQNPKTISDNVAAGSHNQGINIHTGPLGEVYAVWAVYDNFPANEKALGFARSLNGGQSWEPATRIFDNIKGIRLQGVNKLMRTNSFPSMAVDISNGPNRGTIYVVWANVGIPGINEGSGIDIYMIKSADQGVSWSEPQRINQDIAGTGKQHYFPWISCDSDNGFLSVIFYDDRNVPDEMCEAWVAVSKNGGLSWQDFRVSDVAFTPTPLTGMADNYFGDYLGITAKGGMVYPCWTDNRTGGAMAYVSPFRLSPPAGQAYIDYFSHFVNDSVTGNGNGIAEYGESFSLAVAMRNIGDQHDSLVTVSLSCESEYVQITGNSSFYGNFETGELKVLNPAFTIQLSDSVPDNYDLVFTLSATDVYDSVFLSSFILKTSAPNLSIGPLLVFDTEGNNNNQPDPGETVMLASVLKNTGKYSVPNATSQLTALQPTASISQPVFNSLELAPGESDTVFWQVTFDPSFEAGLSAAFTDSVTYGYQSSQRLFVRKVGVLTEDWETGDLTKMAWKTSGKRPWSINNFRVYEGRYSLRSGYIESEDTSRFFITLELIADDSISFYRKVSSELNYDFLSFYIDAFKAGQWSGEKDWSRVSFPLTAGRHTLKWEYTKDIGLSVASDAAWIDYIQFPVQQRTTVEAGADAIICEGNTFRPEALATNYITLEWTTSGSGFFSNPYVVNPQYLPSPADMEAGTIQLILTATGFSFGEIISDTVLLTIAPKPEVSAGADAFVCSGTLFKSDASAVNFTNISWLSSGDGIFSNADSISTFYTPGIEDLHAGKALLILKAAGDLSCNMVADTIQLQFLPGISAQIYGDTTICRGDTATIFLSVSGTGPWRAFLSDGSTLTFAKPQLSLPVSPEFTQVFTIDSIHNLAGCSYREPLSVQVNVLQLPEIDLLAPPEACKGQTIILYAKCDSAKSVIWEPGGSTNPVFTPFINGKSGDFVSYKATIEGLNGCKTTDSTQIRIAENCVSRQAGDVNIYIYPNPSNGNFSILLASVSDQMVDIHISSMDNKLVFQSEKIKVSGARLVPVQLRDAAQGTYSISVQSAGAIMKVKIIIR